MCRHNFMYLHVCLYGVSFVIKTLQVDSFLEVYVSILTIFGVHKGCEYRQVHKKWEGRYEYPTVSLFSTFMHVFAGFPSITYIL